jgi:cation:H+ antiporter
MLVAGASRLAQMLGVPPVLIGLTVVAWGTSAPEFFVSLMAALQGSSGLVLGNVLGSNLANIGLILGLAAFMMSPQIDRRLMREDMPILVAGTLVLALVCLDGTISRWDGLLLLSIFLGSLVRMLYKSHQDYKNAGRVADNDETLPGRIVSERGRMLCLALIVLGTLGLSFGGRYIVEAALNIAEAMHVSETLIGLTLVAIGTSLPELATTIVSAWRRESGIALGNVVGSNIFNTMAVTGPVALIRPVLVDRGFMQREIPVLLLVTFTLVVMLRGRQTMGRPAGVILFSMYTATIVWWTMA